MYVTSPFPQPLSLLALDSIPACTGRALHLRLDGLLLDLRGRCSNLDHGLSLLRTQTADTHPCHNLANLRREPHPDGEEGAHEAPSDNSQRSPNTSSTTGHKVRHGEGEKKNLPNPQLHASSRSMAYPKHKNSRDPSKNQQSQTFQGNKMALEEVEQQWRKRTPLSRP